MKSDTLSSPDFDSDLLSFSMNYRDFKIALTICLQILTIVYDLSGIDLQTTVRRLHKVGPPILILNSELKVSWLFTNYEITFIIVYNLFKKNCTNSNFTHVILNAHYDNDTLGI